MSLYSVSGAERLSVRVRRPTFHTDADVCNSDVTVEGLISTESDAPLSAGCEYRLAESVRERFTAAILQTKGFASSYT